MLKTRFFLGFFFFSVLLSPLHPVQANPNFAITFDGQYSRILTHANDLDHWNGSGGTLFLEFQPVDYFSLGLAGNFTVYWGVETPGPSYSAFADGVLRIMPLGFSGRFSPYLMGSFGWNPVSTINIPGWKGELHGMAGLGTRYFVDSTSAMDIGFNYQLFSPFSDPLQTANFHVGLSFFVDPIPSIAKPMNAPFKAQIRYDSLQAIAGREFGDPDLYPLLVDANRMYLARNMVLPKGFQLIIPRNITAEMIRLAKSRANDPKYLEAAANYHDPYLSEDYQAANRSTGSSWVPIAKKKRSFIPFHAESLWDVAARFDVYGDPELYPLLVDANYKRLQANYPLKSFKLIIPSVSAEALRQARIKAWAVQYIIWRGKDVHQKKYEKEQLGTQN